MTLTRSGTDSDARASIRELSNKRNEEGERGGNGIQRDEERMEGPSAIQISTPYARDSIPSLCV